MKIFLDTSVLVEPCLAASPKFPAADRLVSRKDAFTSAHALAEAYATLSGDPRLRINPANAAQIIDDLAGTLNVWTFEFSDYRALISAAPSKGIRGGAIYDALHAQTARLAGCDEIHTLNVGHFRHVAADLKIVPL
jgi:predicted nucleic acid-binding protein